MLEVLPEYQKKGIGKELIKRIEHSLRNMYAIDVVCDDDVSALIQEDLITSNSKGTIDPVLYTIYIK